MESEKHLLHAASILARIDGKSDSKYQSGQIIYSQGDPASFVFYVRAGRVRVAIVSEKGSYSRNPFTR
jgi:CRP-like cAMP-binding protein